MNFQAKAQIHSSPGVELVNRLAPFRCSAHVHGQVSAETGAIIVHLAEIPVAVRIPFLKRRAALITIGTAGPAKLKVDPITCSLKELSFHCDATVGDKEGLTLVTEGKMQCSSELGVEGVAGGDISLGSIHVGTARPPEFKRRPKPTRAK
jgi:hypothetical protein